MNPNPFLDRASDVPWPTHRDVSSDIAVPPVSQETTVRRRQTQPEWADGARTSVRSHPLAWVAAAAALGILVARFARFAR